MMYQGKNIKISDHPLGIIVQQEWDYIPLFDNTFVMDRFLRRE